MTAQNRGMLLSHKFWCKHPHAQQELSTEFVVKSKESKLNPNNKLCMEQAVRKHMGRWSPNPAPVQALEKPPPHPLDVPSHHRVVIAHHELRAPGENKSTTSKKSSLQPVNALGPIGLTSASSKLREIVGRHGHVLPALANEGLEKPPQQPIGAGWRPPGRRRCCNQHYHKEPSPPVDSSTDLRISHRHHHQPSPPPSTLASVETHRQKHQLALTTGST
ncbi:Os05g0423050 [Oryza sativa Japonica Group]|uniref:Os05g0423050 protein n=1 Tax=Oryza sativa subsp. japonica TaxID=39947 RepID=A0A0P0WMG1_ORYSJ|nr:Os05g0423050 [Oryza sativa Japonica Group]